MKIVVATLILFVTSPQIFATSLINSVGLSSPAHHITFDEHVFAQDTIVDTQYAAEGVTFTTGMPFDTIGLNTIIAEGINGHYLGNFGPGLINPFSIFFNENVTEAAFGFASEPQTTTLDAYLDGVFVESFALETSLTSEMGYLGFTDSLFDEIRVTGNGGSGSALIDNIQFSNVPVPAAIWFMGSGLLGLLGFSRKSKAQTIAT